MIGFLPRPHRAQERTIDLRFKAACDGHLVAGILAKW